MKPLYPPKQYLAAKPFPHVVLDHFYSAKELRRMLSQWPEQGHKQYRYGKRAFNDVRHLPFFQDMLSTEFCQRLQRLTGIERLLADQTLDGGGLHEVLPGGKLDVHVDFNAIDLQGQRLYRRVNLLLYLNTEWEPEWRGALELWEGDAEGPQTKIQEIQPLFNRVVIFNASESSWHGHPHFLACPPGRTRRSAAVYYYTLERPNWFQEKHSTIYRDTADE